jgi:hypothetical protein
MILQVLQHWGLPQLHAVADAVSEHEAGAQVRDVASLAAVRPESQGAQAAVLPQDVERALGT